MKTRPFLLAVLLLCSAQASHAALEALIVSGARTEQSSLSTPASIQVITRAQIRASGAAHVVDVLRGQGAVYVKDNYGDGSRATVSMRGFSGDTAASNTLIMIDGRRLNNTDISAIDLNSVAIADIERIEIVQGSAGVLFGDQAVGGVINIITQPVIGDATRIEAGAGSYSTAVLRASHTQQFDADNGIRLSAELRRSDNYRRDNNAIEYANVLLKTDHGYTGGNLFLELQHITEDLELPGSLLQSEVAADRRQTFVDFRDDYTDSRTQVVRIGHRHNLDDEWSLHTELAARDVERDIQQSFRGFVVTTPSRLDRKQVDLTPRLVGRFQGEHGETRVTTGIDVTATDLESGITSSTDEQTMIAFYAQGKLPLSDSVDVTLGARHAEVEDEVTSFVVNGTKEADADALELGVVFHLDERSRVFARLDQNFRFAKADELTYVSDGATLEPQTGNSFEFGWKRGGEAARVGVTAYLLELEDEIAFDPSAPTPTGGTFAGANVNFGETSHRGVILELDSALTAELRLTANFSYTRAEFDNGSNASKSISGVPQNVARLGLNQRVSDALWWQLDAVYTGSRYVEGDNANALPKADGYTVIDLNLVYEQKDWSAGLKINNLTDRLYIENANSFGSLYPMPERNFMLTASWQLR